jgi:hypothetical protein
LPSITVGITRGSSLIAKQHSSACDLLFLKSQIRGLAYPEAHGAEGIDDVMEKRSKGFGGSARNQAGSPWKPSLPR